MPDYFYFDQAKQKYGPISEQQLRELAAAGTIKPNTPMETVEGHKGIAKQIPGLKFTPSAISSAISGSAVPEWYAWATVICGIALSVLTLFVFGGGYSHSIVGFWSAQLRDIVFVVGMFFGCRGMSTNKAGTAKVGLIICIIAFAIPRLYWCFVAIRG
jgi:hypothetical protein